MPPRWQLSQGGVPWLLSSEGQRGQQVGSEVEEEYLEHADGEGESAAGKRPDHERGELGDVVGEVVGEEFPDVAESAAALLDRSDDGGEVVVEQNQIAGLAGDVGAAGTHCDPDVRLVQGGA